MITEKDLVERVVDEYADDMNQVVSREDKGATFILLC